MKTKRNRRFPALSLAVAAMFVTLNAPLSLSTAFAQGSLTPPGAPAPTMKSLDQIEARTAITNTSSLAIISQPGSYYLTHNLTVSTGDAIDINTNGVTLDLNGFTISSTAASAAGCAILLNGGLTALTDITIANGHIRGGVTNNGSGAYSGSGFGCGIYYAGGSPVNVLVSKVSVSGCRDHGIYLRTGDSTVVESCTVRTVGSYGISASTIKSCMSMDCGGAAIYGNEVSDSRGQCSSSSYGLSANTAQNCYGQSTSGYGLTATTAHNCYGTSSSSYGLYAGTAQNCRGYSSSSCGLYASVSATGCYGYSSSGTGLSAFIANVCHGETSSGTALSATHNVNSY